MASRVFAVWRCLICASSGSGLGVPESQTQSQVPPVPSAPMVPYGGSPRGDTPPTIGLLLLGALSGYEPWRRAKRGRSMDSAAVTVGLARDPL